MKSKHIFIKPIFVVTCLSLLYSCDLNQENIQVGPDVEITNDPSSLQKRLDGREDTLNISYYGAANGKELADTLLLITKLEVATPTVQGNALQAASLSERGNQLVVSYNFAGAPYWGGVDYLSYKDYQKKPGELSILSQILMEDAEVHHAGFNGSALYMAGATDFIDVPAYVCQAKITGNSLSAETTSFVGLGSYAATSVAVDDSRIYVTTGNDETNGGGLYQLDFDLNIAHYIPLHDARWVKATNDKLFVAQGTPGMISVIDPEDFSVISQIAVDGADAPESKTTLDVADGMLFFAAGENGVLIFDEQSGQQLHHLTFPEANSITNAVSVEDNMIFISNGEGGIYIAGYNKNDKQQAPQLIGKLSVGDHVSVNHILYSSKKLYVAAGIEGVKIIEVK